MPAIGLFDGMANGVGVLTISNRSMMTHGSPMAGLREQNLFFRARKIFRFLTGPSVEIE